jgi:ubiquitin-activating enzyme E1
LEINKFAHANGILFIAAEVHGLFASAFNDFGKGFSVVDVTGEEALSGMIAEISTDGDGIVTCLDETRHGLEDGDHVTFVEIVGMEALNGCEPRKVRVLGPYTFSIGDTTGLGAYVRGGLFQQVKMPKAVDFVSFMTSFMYLKHTSLQSPLSSPDSSPTIVEPRRVTREARVLDYRFWKV